MTKFAQSKFAKSLENRLKNYGFWTSAISLVPIVCQMAGITDLPKDYAVTLNTILVFLVSAGLVNNPDTQNKGFFDDKKDVTKE